MLCYFRLKRADQAARKISLLSYMERGWMYTQLKERIPTDGQSWMDICKELGVCSRTVNRYILFYEISSVYPRIIICNIAFETLMYCKDEIANELYNNWGLGVRFRVPLRNVEIRGNIQFDGCLLYTSPSPRD